MSYNNLIEKIKNFEVSWESFKEELINLYEKNPVASYELIKGLLDLALMDVKVIERQEKEVLSIFTEKSVELYKKIIEDIKIKESDFIKRKKIDIAVKDLNNDELVMITKEPYPSFIYKESKTKAEQVNAEKVDNIEEIIEQIKPLHEALTNDEFINTLIKYSHFKPNVIKNDYESLIKEEINRVLNDFVYQKEEDKGKANQNINNKEKEIIINEILKINEPRKELSELINLNEETSIDLFYNNFINTTDSIRLLGSLLSMLESEEPLKKARDEWNKINSELPKDFIKKEDYEQIKELLLKKGFKEEDLIKITCYKLNELSKEKEIKDYLTSLIIKKPDDYKNLTSKYKNLKSKDQKIKNKDEEKLKKYLSDKVPLKNLIDFMNVGKKEKQTIVLETIYESDMVNSVINTHNYYLLNPDNKQVELYNGRIASFIRMYNGTKLLEKEEFRELLKGAKAVKKTQKIEDKQKEPIKNLKKIPPIPTSPKIETKPTEDKKANELIESLKKKSKTKPQLVFNPNEKIKEDEVWSENNNTPVAPTKLQVNFFTIKNNQREINKATEIIIKTPKLEEIIGLEDIKEAEKPLTNDINQLDEYGELTENKPVDALIKNLKPKIKPPQINIPTVVETKKEQKIIPPIPTIQKIEVPKTPQIPVTQKAKEPIIPPIPTIQKIEVPKTPQIPVTQKAKEIIQEEKEPIIQEEINWKPNRKHKMNYYLETIKTIWQ